MLPEMKLCPVHRVLCDERAGGMVLSHSKRKERVLNGARSIEGELSVKELDRATCRPTRDRMT